MPGQALLIGSQLGGLSGVGNDLEAIGRALDARGLSVTRCTGNDATRAGILDACADLVAKARPDNPVVLFYSGHGGRVAAPDHGEASLGGALRPEPSDLGFIVPVDFHASTDDDFRGITSVELSVIFARLTAATRNVTVIFECAHAASLARSPSRFVEGPPGTLIVRQGALGAKAPYERLRAHLDRLREVGELPADLWRASNPDVVRLSACAPEQTAFEYTGADGRRIGLFTESLVLALDAAGSAPVTWATVLDYVRGRVLTLAPSQRPEIAGPFRRLLFDTAEQDSLSALPVTNCGAGRASLACAPLLEVQRGDRFVIMPPGEVRADPWAGVGLLEVDQVGPLTAQGPVIFLGGATGVPLGAGAFRVAAAAHAAPVLLPARDPRAVGLVSAIAGQPLLRAAESGEPWVAAVRFDSAGQYVLEDRIGPVAPSRRNDVEGIDRTVRDLTALARAAALRVATSAPQWALDAPVTFSWGLVDRGERHPLPAAGATVHVGQSIYLCVRNDSSVTVYVSMIDIGVTAGITVLTRFSPSGERLDPGREYIFGFDHYRGVLTGSAVVWPDHLSLEHARQETVLLLVTSEPQDVSVLEQDGLTRDRGRPASPLEAMLEQIASGAVRAVGAATGAPGGYDIHAVDFELDPTPDAGVFAIDERPSKVALLRTAREHSGALVRHADPEPPTVAVRIEEVNVLHNRAFFRARADVRLDALVVTAPHGADRPVYQVRTARFARIRSGEALPVDRMLIYHGPAVEYLDLALWFSRDSSDSRDLGELLAEEFAGFEMQEALAKASDTFISLPYAVASLTALSLSAVCINVAYKYLRGTVNGSIGLYRGSRLAHEDFGVGRHPRIGVERMQDVSLAFSIERVPAVHAAGWKAPQH
jgi:hypothetical protein